MTLNPDYQIFKCNPYISEADERNEGNKNLRQQKEVES